MYNNLVDESDSVSDVLNTRNLLSNKKRKKLAEHDYAKKISPRAITKKDE